MRCHYEHIKGVGKVFIPGCMGGAVAGDLSGCTCDCGPKTFRAYERGEYNKEIKILKAKIRELEDENEYCRKLFEKNEIEYDFNK